MGGGGGGSSGRRAGLSGTLRLPPSLHITSSYLGPQRNLGSPSQDGSSGKAPTQTGTGAQGPSGGNLVTISGGHRPSLPC